MIRIDKKQLYEGICRRIEETRKEDFSGSARQWAKELGFPYQTYLGYERDKVSVEVIWAIREKTKRSMKWLITGEGEKYEMSEEQRESFPEELKLLIGKLLKIRNEDRSKYDKYIKFINIWESE